MSYLKGLIYGVLLTIIMLVGCSNNEIDTQQDTEKPVTIQNVFFMYEEEYTNIDDRFGVPRSFGNLYMITEGTEKDKVASDVKDGSFYYIENKNKVLFIDQGNTLYEYAKGKEKTKLAEDVEYFTYEHEEDAITYESLNGELYYLNADETEKIATDFTQYELNGDTIYFMKENDTLLKYNVKSNQEMKIAENAVHFQVLSKDDEIAYVNDDYFLYYQKGDEPSFKIASETVSARDIKKIDDNLIYYVDNEGYYDLYIAPLATEKNSKILANQVKEYEYINGFYYYITEDGNLYKKVNANESATKIASDVIKFTVSDDNVYFLNNENILFQLGKENTADRFANSVEDFVVSQKNEVIYSTKEKELFVDDKKIGNGIEGFHYYFGNLAYTDESGKLYLLENLDEQQVVFDDLQSFSNAYYQNEMIYRNELEFADIAGVWKNEEMDGYLSFFKIGNDGSFTFFAEDVPLQLEKSTSYSFNELQAYLDGTSVTFTPNSDKTLTMEYDDHLFILSPSSQEEVDKYHSNQQLEADKSSIEYLIDEYLTDFERAVNYGSPEYITDYMDPASSMYTEQINFVLDTYEKGIQEQLNDYSITNISPSSNNEYIVQVREIFTIYSEGTGTAKTYNNTYTIKYTNGQFLISDIKSKQVGA